MGAWGRVVRSALEVTESDYLELPDGSNAIAAAEVIAALQGQPASRLPNVVQEWVAGHQGIAGLDDARKAIAALDRVLAEESELKTLWYESTDGGSWHDSTADLRRRLASVRL